MVRAKSGATENGAVLMMIVSNRKREPGDPESSSVFRGEDCDCRGIKFALYYLLLRRNSIFCTERLLFAVERVEMVCYYERAIAAHLHREAAHISLADSWRFASAKKTRVLLAR